MLSNKLSTSNLYTVFTALFCGSLLISNVLASKIFVIGNITLPSAVIVFPLVYIVNDVLTEIYGFQKARNAILLGFVINLIAVIAYKFALLLPSPEYIDVAAFNTVLGSTSRVLIASFAAYLIGSLVNAYVMVKLKKWNDEHLMFRCVMSTLAGETLDAIIFITVAFAFTMPFSQMLMMIVVQAMFKTVYEIVCYPITKEVIRKIKVITNKQSPKNEVGR